MLSRDTADGDSMGLVVLSLQRRSFTWLTVSISFPQGKPGDDGKPGLNGKNVSDGPDPHPQLEKWGFRPDRQGIVVGRAESGTKIVLSFPTAEGTGGEQVSQQSLEDKWECAILFSRARMGHLEKMEGR